MNIDHILNLVTIELDDLDLDQLVPGLSVDRYFELHNGDIVDIAEDFADKLTLDFYYDEYYRSVEVYICEGIKLINITDLVHSRKLDELTDLAVEEVCTLSA